MKILLLTKLFIIVNYGRRVDGCLLKKIEKGIFHILLFHSLTYIRGVDFLTYDLHTL